MGSSCSQATDATPAGSPAKKAPAEPFIFMHDSEFRSNWNIVMFFTVVFIAVVVPLRIGFQILDWRPWIGPDIVVDILLFCSVIIDCFTTFELDGEVIMDRNLIRWRYLKSWLIPDVLSVVPLEIAVAGYGSYNPLMRVNRLIRIPRLVTFFLAWERASSLKPSIIRIFKLTFVILFFAHFFGCMFILVVLIEGNDAGIEFTVTPNITDRSFTSQYFRAFFWSLVTLTGYNNTMPTTVLEAAFNIVVTMTGISMFATIIGTVGSLVTNLDNSKLYFRQKMDGINDYMKYKRIPADLQDEVRNYYSYMWKSGKGIDENQVLDDLPPQLRQKMSVWMNSEIIRKVPLFQQCKDDEEFITAIVKCLKSRVCLPNSFVVRKGEMGTEMYFISRGELNIVNDQDKVVFTLRDGGFFGEIALLYDTKRTASVVARTYCDMFILTKEDFKKVLKKFPAQSKGIKEIAKERFQGIVEQEKKKEESLKLPPPPPQQESTPTPSDSSPRERPRETAFPTAGEPQQEADGAGEASPPGSGGSSGVTNESKPSTSDSAEK